MQALSKATQLRAGKLQKSSQVLATVSVFVMATCAGNAFANSASKEKMLNESVDQKLIQNSLVAKYSKLPTISAVLKKYNQHNPDTVVTNWIKLSPAGMRVRDVQSNSEVIKNFKQQRVWLTNKRNKTSHEVDVAFYREYFPEQVPYLVGPASISNISGVEPCAELAAHYIGRRVWRGQIVGEWRCQYEDGSLANTQLFSDQWNLVVQVRHTDKSIEELVDIKSEIFTEDSFVPDKALRHVEITEFMTGRRLLDSYSP